MSGVHTVTPARKTRREKLNYFAGFNSVKLIRSFGPQQTHRYHHTVAKEGKWHCKRAPPQAASPTPARPEAPGGCARHQHQESCRWKKAEHTACGVSGTQAGRSSVRTAKKPFYHSVG